MAKQKKHMQIIIRMLICAIIVIVGACTATEQAHAIGYDYSSEYAPSFKWYNSDSSNSNGPGKGTNKTLTKCVPGVSAIGEAFVHGGNGVVDKLDGNGVGVSVQCYVDNDSQRDSVYIQGKKINKGWIVRGNIQHLWNLHHTPALVGTINYAESDKNIGWPSSAFDYEYLAYEGEKLQIVDYDEDWVYFWSTGFKAFENNTTGYCKNWLLLRSHPAGFYRISKDHVWIDLYNDNTFAKENDKIYGEGYATVARTDLYHKAGNTSTGPCYQVPVNTKLIVVDSTPKTVTVNGKEKKYYKVRFTGNNETYYMGYKMYHVYVESKYLNVYKYDKNGNIKIPQNSAKAYINNKNVSLGNEIIYTSKSTSSSKFYGALGDGAKFYVDADKSDSNWAAVQFNDQIGYVPITYKVGAAQTLKILNYYVDELKLVDIKNNKYYLSWGKVPAKVTVMFRDKNGKIIKVNDKSYTTYAANTEYIVVNNAVFKGREGYSGGVTVQAGVAGTTVTSDKTASIKLLYPGKPFSLIARGKNNNGMTIAQVEKGGQLQYSTSSSFKNAKSVQTTGNAATIKGLTKNKTYYFRFRNKMTANTENGNKAIYGDWSKTLAAKTTNITMKTPVLKTPKGSKKFGMIYWKKYTGSVNKYEVVVATNKAFTKNVKKTVALRGRTSIGIDKLKAKKKYYVRMRAVYTQSGATYYSKWSSVKTFKTK